MKSGMIHPRPRFCSPPSFSLPEGCRAFSRMDGCRTAPCARCSPARPTRARSGGQPLTDGQRGEVIAGQAPLLAGRLGTIDHLPERGILRPVLRVPAQVLARDAHAGLLAVECVELFEMAEQDRADFD